MSGPGRGTVTGPATGAGPSAPPAPGGRTLAPGTTAWGDDPRARGAGVPIVVVNALGQGPGYWGRLATALAPRPVLLRDARTYEPDGSVSGPERHDADLAAVLDDHCPSGVHLLGWCTGAKPAMRLAARDDAGRIRSVTLLSPSLRHPGRPAGLDTDYERELATLCRTVVDRPRTADRVRRALIRVMFDDAADPAARPDPALEAERRRPFASASALTAYAEQLLAFWSQDPTGDARRVGVPVLAVGGSADPVVSFAAQRAVLDLARSVRRHEVPAGTHYLMHDRATAVAGLVGTFLRECEDRYRARPA